MGCKSSQIVDKQNVIVDFFNSIDKLRPNDIEKKYNFMLVIDSVIHGQIAKMDNKLQEKIQNWIREAKLYFKNPSTNIAKKLIKDKLQIRRSVDKLNEKLFKITPYKQKIIANKDMLKDDIYNANIDISQINQINQNNQVNQA